eukprot:CAMPEP_0118923890 /NCGR_PEP_ID=MMETSP1169-20130426/2251_1 /TAXON_ID=36882 /ORGANISM="Pyramimonas obovata, Strain CCMP722" /LENGTH=294 /DNA_ID=CAMNT_0006864945 /DNA_START=55 /DNA_END=939 /DNA_ORIENTATION=-
MSAIANARVPTFGGRVALKSGARSRAAPARLAVVCSAAPPKPSKQIELKAKSAYEAAQSVIALLKKQSISAQSRNASEELLSVSSVEEANSTIERLQTEVTKWQMANTAAQDVAKAAKLEVVTLREQLTLEKQLHDKLTEDLKTQTEMIKELAVKATNDAKEGKLESVTKVTQALGDQAETAASLKAVEESKKQLEDQLQASHELIFEYEKEIGFLRGELESLRKEVAMLKAADSGSTGTSDEATEERVTKLQTELKAALEGSAWKDQHYGTKIKSLEEKLAASHELIGILEKA